MTKWQKSQLVRHTYLVQRVLDFNRSDSKYLHNNRMCEHTEYAEYDMLRKQNI